MDDYRDHAPAYRTFRVAPRQNLRDVIADQEAWEARERYPDMLGLGLPAFFHAQECEAGGWLLSEYFTDTPQGSRDSLGSHFRRAEHEGREAGADEETLAAYRAAYERLDEEPLNELTVLGTRHRIVRAGQFVRSGPYGPEPPRPSDPDAPDVDEKVPSRTKGLVVDPWLPDGISDSLLKRDLVNFVGVAPGAPPEVREDALRALHTHPGGVLLPAMFMFSERESGGRWRPSLSLHNSPQEARDSLAFAFRVFEPMRRPDLTEEDLAAYETAAARIEENRRMVVTCLGVRHRLTRVERMIRMGPDGPEGPRPSDHDPEAPVNVLTRDLKARGLWNEEDGSDPTRTPEEESRIAAGAADYTRRYEAELTRKKAAKAAKEARAARAAGKRGAGSA